ncbi:uncharacterized protein TM35_000061880 [Trypanosoma theileri]|uniref:Uncharacterized protein n=1 Tax=Trypanosoma theileri TaxID=67003 RepID=A0A1X0P3A7_9TRYP|nr:uncharacterized protein TM35_000061880 [Trypanosoma theileri]ORC91183.1 hypothetical protein TM35_000061880 [Trypanosoma theileri]
MKRDAWLAVLQSMPWVPCAESSGLPRYRAVEAYHCTYCAYTVCASCYNAIPTGLLLSARESNSTVRGSGGQKQQQQQHYNGTNEDEFCKPQCFLCRRGVLVLESAPVYEWTCEGPRPARRLLRGVDASYDMDVVQRYYTMKEQREKRAHSKAPLIAHFHSADPPHWHFASNSNSNSSSTSYNNIHNKNGTPVDVFGSGATCRRPSCEEGSGFVFSIENPRMQQSCVWCAVNRQLRDNHPSLLGDATITPLQTFWCPPSLPGIPPRLFRVEVPYGVYGLHNVHALALYLTDDIFRKATTKLQMSNGNAKTMGENSEQQKQSLHGQLTSGKVLPRDVVRPLIIVDILHRVASSEPLRGLLDVRWFISHVLKDSQNTSPELRSQRSVIAEEHSDTKKSQEECEVVRNEGKMREGNAQEIKGQPENLSSTTVQIPECDEKEEKEKEENKDGNYTFTSWPYGLRCDELLLTVDHLLHGRSVGVYGIASKYFFLQHVSQSAELRYHGVVEVDGYRSTNHQVVRQLRDVRKHLADQQQRAERELLRSLFQQSAHAEPYGVDDRSGAPAREAQQEQEEKEEEEDHQQEEHYYHSVDSSPQCSQRSQSYRTPVRSLARHDGMSQSRRRYTNEMNTNVDDALFTLKSSRLATPPPPPPSSSSTQEIKGGLPPCSPAPHAGQREDSIILVQGDEQEMGIRGRPPLYPPNRQHPPPPTTETQQQQQTQKGSSDRMCFADRISHSDEKGRTWSRWHWLREHSNWNFDVPFRSAHTNKRPREEGEKEKEETSKQQQQQELSSHERGPRVPRFVISPEILKPLRLACRAPLRSCISWMSLPSLTAHHLISDKLPSPATGITPPLRSGYDNTPAGRHTLLIVHGVDQLDATLLLELQSIAREYPYRIVLLCSFDDPKWPTSNSAALLDPFRMSYVHLRSLLLPRVHEMSGINSLALLTEMEASAAGGGKFGNYNNRGRNSTGGFAGGAGLPLHDTIRRILFSLPATFSELLRCMIARQEAAGENVFIPVSLHQQHFDECGLMVSMGRLKAIERELTSNRLAIFNSAENKLLIPQHRRLLKVLEEVEAQRRGSNAAADGTGGGVSAPVEA